MQLADIRSSVRFLIFGDSTDTSYSDTDIDRNINKNYRKWLTSALLCNGHWQVRGTYALIDLLAGVNKYPISTEILKFNRAEAKLTADGEFQTLTPVDINDPNTTLETYAPASPEFDLRGGYLTIYTSETIEDVEDGLKLYVQRDLTELAETDDEPELAEAFIELIILDTALDYCLTEEMTTKGREIERKIDKRKPEFEEYYSNRSNQSAVLNFEQQNYY